MRAIYTFLMLIFLCYNGFCQVGIGTATPDANAALDISSANKALLVPRLSGNAVNSISGTEGMIAFDTDNHNLVNFTGTEPVVVTPAFSLIAYSSYPANPAAAIGQSYTALSTFTLQDVTTYLGNFVAPTTYTLKVYSGSGMAGSLLGTSSPITVPTTGGNALYTFNLASENITLQAGNVYTFYFSFPGSEGRFFVNNGNVYNGGVFYRGALADPGSDLYFSVRKKGPTAWSPLVNGFNAQTIAGAKTFTEDISTPGIITPFTGSANMLAAAYGVVISSGTVLLNSSNNCSVSHPATGQYIVNFSGALAGQNLGDLPVVVTMYGSSPGQVTFQGNGAGSGSMTVFTFNSIGTPADRGFSFAVYRP